LTTLITHRHPVPPFGGTGNSGNLASTHRVTCGAIPMGTGMTPILDL